MKCEAPQLESVISINKKVVSCELGEEVKMLNMDDGVYYTLNSVGAKIWKLIQKPKTVEKVLEILMEEYDVEKERCKNDLMNLLHELLDKVLIEINNENPV